MDPELEAPTPQTARVLQAQAIGAQREHRIPGLLAALARRGAPLWSTGVGSADLDRPGVPHDLDTQVAVASNTKTFTAVLVMQLRDEGRLELDDPVAEHLPGGDPRITVAQLLSHSAGLQREPAGDPWIDLDFPDRERLVHDWPRAEQVLPRGSAWHYSNLGYAALGEIVARLDGRDWAEALQARLLTPLGLDRTGLEARDPAAGRYYVPPFTDVPVVEPALDKAAIAPAGGLLSTARDMARWHAFLIDPDPAVLAPATMEEMCQPRAVADADGWTRMHGLGWMLIRSGGRTWVGHTGGLPGARTAFFTERDSGTTAMIASNATTGGDPAAVAVDLGTTVLDREPPPPEPWIPGTAVPRELEPLLGRWYSEGDGFTMAVRAGSLIAVADGSAPDAPPSVFEALGPDTFRTTSGRERGELLRVHRRDDGSVRQLVWSGYRFTREPLGFDEPTP